MTLNLKHRLKTRGAQRCLFVDSLQYNFVTMSQYNSFCLTLNYYGTYKARIVSLLHARK